MSETMELSQDQFEQIGSYVRRNLGNWMQELSPPASPLDPVLVERIVRVEEELKSQRELMKQGFEQVDKRFEEMRADTNARFAQVDKRFEEMREDMKSGFEVSRSHTNHWMTFLTIVLLVMGAAMTLATVLAG
jgi:hypothetical protein